MPHFEGPKNPHHHDFLVEESLRDRRAKDLGFGDSITFSSATTPVRFLEMFGPPRGIDLVSVIALAADHRERRALDDHCRAILARDHESLGVEAGIGSMMFGAGADVSCRIAHGIAGLEAYYLILIGNQGYRVTQSSSQRFFIRPENEIITLESDNRTDSEFLGSLPSLSVLREMQSVRGSELRECLGGFPELAHTKMADLMSTIRSVSPDAPFPTIAIELPNDREVKDQKTIEARFYFDKEGRINSFELL